MAVTASRVGTALVTDCGMDEADGTEKKDAKDGFMVFVCHWQALCLFLELGELGGEKKLDGSGDCQFIQLCI